MVQSIVAIRNAVRPHLEKLEAGDKFLVGFSGGADSLALAAALLKEAEPLALTAIAITVDHQLQENSSANAERVALQLKEMGYGKVLISKVVVSTESGIEAGARDARYKAFEKSVAEEKAVKVFLGHTHNDQAETVLLGLARGSGTRSLSGMAEDNGIYCRPLLAITRDETEKACQELGIPFWNDPHNFDTEFTRVRVRREVIPFLESHLDPGISKALVRSAALFRDDADALDEWAAKEWDRLKVLECEYLSGLPRAIRTRMIRLAAYEAGVSPGTLTSEQVGAVEALISAWKGQGAIALSGGVKVERISGRLTLSKDPV